MKSARDLVLALLWAAAAVAFVIGPAVGFVINDEYDRLAMLAVFYLIVGGLAIVLRGKDADDQ